MAKKKTKMSKKKVAKKKASKKKASKKKVVKKKVRTKAAGEDLFKAITDMEAECPMPDHGRHAFVCSTEGRTYCVHCNGTLKNVPLSPEFKREMELDRKADKEARERAIAISMLDACMDVLGHFHGKANEKKWNLFFLNTETGKSNGTVRSRFTDAMQELAKSHGLVCSGTHFDGDDDDDDDQK